ncbi:dUTP diphosphatase [Psychrosphaera sp. B3R10]|uniref:dUTP diphosphatase n=1 Tax=unclassified Psychrosphaera TaxID=2641570 RepID=UPI001C096429|nr:MULTISPECIES: dUTP diphosphatase [unclassified Psychrosphaera]MBU2882624.1 dUTP diphosphatase [Psychrosphaera sp. I2R16]MBU2989357.1 dUTP diphosphatase [Psychrosphaera sp. B3R10]
MKQQILTMLQMQDDMNTKVHPQWREQGFAWHRAIWVELAEMLDHYGWKWWKHQSPDIEQVHLELIDIFHFGLSARLVTGQSVSEIADEIAAELLTPKPADTFAETIEAMVASTLATKSFDVLTFAGLMQQTDLSFEELFRHYVGKNVLNFFRQDHGYKTGEYIKIWNGKEDNEVLMDVLRATDATAEDFKDKVYNGLKAAYPA